MKTSHKRSPVFLVGGLALALMACAAFAANPPPDPDPTSKGKPMEDTTSPTPHSTTPYSSSSSTSSSATSSDISSQTIGMQSKFDSLDVNHDGYVDKQEAAADSKLKNQFAKLDANKDAKLSIMEFSSAKGLAMNKKSKSNDDSGDAGKQKQQ